MNFKIFAILIADLKRRTSIRIERKVLFRDWKEMMLEENLIFFCQLRNLIIAIAVLLTASERHVSRLFSIGTQWFWLRSRLFCAGICVGKGVYACEQLSTLKTLKCNTEYWLRHWKKSLKKAQKCWSIGHTLKRFIECVVLDQRVFA